MENVQIQTSEYAGECAYHVSVHSAVYYGNWKSKTIWSHTLKKIISNTKNAIKKNCITIELAIPWLYLVWGNLSSHVNSTGYTF